MKTESHYGIEFHMFTHEEDIGGSRGDAALADFEGHGVKDVVASTWILDANLNGTGVAMAGVAPAISSGDGRVGVFPFRLPGGVHRYKNAFHLKL